MRTNLKKSFLLFGVLLLVPSLVAANPTKAPAGGTAPAAAPSSEAGPRLQFKNGSSIPLFSEEAAEVPVAKVGDDAITVRDLGESLAMTHSQHAGAAKKQDFDALLQRLMDARLIVLEARDMGLDELPEVKNAIASWRTQTLREALKSREASKVKLDAKAVESVYRQMVQEWKVRSVLFEKDADAAAFAASAKDGKTFTAAAAKAIASGAAKGTNEAEWLGRAKALPQVVAVLEKTKVGEVCAPTKVGAAGSAVLFVEDTRFPDVPQARAEAEAVVRGPASAQALRGYYKSLTKKHATVDRKLLASIDFKKSRLDALAKDKRAIARIKGEAPVTVADLHAELKNQFFHGLDRAAAENKINPRKQQFFDSILFRRLLDKEAKEERIAENPAFRRDAAEFERSVLFAAFVERVIVPEVKVDDESVKAYYDGHKAELRYPDFYTLETIGFRQAREAQAACEKLKAGTDVKWLKANIEGKLDAKNSVELDGKTVTAESMPDGLESALSGTSAGDCRIWPKAADENYSVLVVEKIASRVQSLDEAKGEIQKAVFKEKLARSIEDWAKKLREGHEVTVFVTAIAG